jgi:hypothetical protein
MRLRREVVGAHRVFVPSYDRHQTVRKALAERATIPSVGRAMTNNAEQTCAIVFCRTCGYAGVLELLDRASTGVAEFEAWERTHACLPHATRRPTDDDCFVPWTLDVASR